MDKDGVVIEHLDQILPPGLVIDYWRGKWIYSSFANQK